MDALKEQPQYAELVKTDAVKIESLFEDIFQHAEFTGRSGTFFAYEGLGSIYWHMVSKLLLAVQETIIRTRSESNTCALMDKYVDIRKGLSFNKTAENYRAFPTDPYSHTPKGQGAKQPGVTGLVKEEILTRQAELGYFIENSNLVFDFLMLDKNAFLAAPTIFNYFAIDWQSQTIDIKESSPPYPLW